MRTISHGGSIAVLCFLAGCNAPSVTISSNPGGANVLVNGEDVGTTPVKHTFDYSKLTYYDVLVRKTGYLEMTQHLVGDTDAAHRDMLSFDLPVDPAFKETTSSPAVNQWMRVEVSQRVSRESMWQTLVDAVTSRYSNVEQMDSASGYIRSVPLIKIYKHPTTGADYTIRTQFIGSLVSAQPLVFKFKVQSDFSDQPDHWRPFERVFAGDQQLVEELQNRLGLK